MTEIQVPSESKLGFASLGFNLYMTSLNLTHLVSPESRRILADSRSISIIIPIDFLSINLTRMNTLKSLLTSVSHCSFSPPNWMSLIKTLYSHYQMLLKNVTKWSSIWVMIPHSPAYLPSITQICCPVWKNFSRSCLSSSMSNLISLLSGFNFTRFPQTDKTVPVIPFNSPETTLTQSPIQRVWPWSMVAFWASFSGSSISESLDSFKS